MSARYLHWRGKNTFFCGGRLMTGSHPKQLLRTFIIILVSWLLYIFLVAPFFSYKWLIPVAISQFEIHCVLLCLTAFTDPGIIPRQCNKSAIGSRSIGYCNVCEVYRDSRARHCRYCDNCVDVFDHHCPWTGTCIGLRNYPYFFLFLVSVTLSLLFVLLSTALLLLAWIFHVPTDAYLLRCIAVCVMIPWSLALLLPTSLLLGFHIYLVLTGQTTCEYFSTKRQRQQMVLTQKREKSVRHVRYAAVLQTHPQQLQHSSFIEDSLEEGTLSALFNTDDSAPEENYTLASSTEGIVSVSTNSSSVGSVSSAFVSLLCILYPVVAVASTDIVPSDSHHCCRCSSVPNAVNRTTLSSVKSLPSTESENDAEPGTTESDVIGPEREDDPGSAPSCCRASYLPAMWQSAHPEEKEEN